MKQMGLALTQYTQDYDESMPLATQCEDQGNGVAWIATHGASYDDWRQLIYPYVKSVKVFECPSNPNAGIQNSNTNYNFTPKLNASYAANLSGSHNSAIGYTVESGSPFSTGYYGSTPPNPPGVSLSKIRQPSATIAVLESVRSKAEFDIGDGLTAAYAGCAISGNSSAYSCLYAGHTSMSNYLFADGHVKTLMPSNTVSASGSLWFNDGGTLASHLNASGMANANTILTTAYGWDR
jgi:prepilin-type processing-associated H-X9-DG protein